MQTLTFIFSVGQEESCQNGDYLFKNVIPCLQFSCFFLLVNINLYNQYRDSFNKVPENHSLLYSFLLIRPCPRRPLPPQKLQFKLRFVISIIYIFFNSHLSFCYRLLQNSTHFDFHFPHRSFIVCFQQFYLPLHILLSLLRI